VPKKKKVPQRMCVGCQEMRPKKELIRVVRTPEDSIEIDFKGKRSGRGAYVCQSQSCFQKARKGRRLEKAFKTSIPREVYDALLKELGEEHE